MPNCIWIHYKSLWNKHGFQTNYWLWNTKWQKKSWNNCENKNKMWEECILIVLEFEKGLNQSPICLDWLLKIYHTILLKHHMKVSKKLEEVLFLIILVLMVCYFVNKAWVFKWYVKFVLSIIFFNSIVLSHLTLPWCALQ